MAESGGVISASAIALGQTVVSYSFFLPPLMEVRRNTDDETLADVRLGQAAGGGLSVGIGFMLTQLTGSWTPTYVALFIAAIIAVVYELAMRQGRGTNASA